MTNFRAHELMENWLQHWMQNELRDSPNFRWIEENLEAFDILTKALWKYDNPEKETTPDYPELH